MAEMQQERETMRNSSRAAVAGVCFLATACLLVGDEPNTKETKYILTIPRLENVQQEDVDDTVNATTEAYNAAIGNLVSQLNGVKTNDDTTYAIYLLGALRARAAVWGLVKIIDFKAEHIDVKLRIARWGEYPAQEALSKIGSPSAPVVLEALGKEDNELRQKLMLMVLRDCYGKDVADFVLQKAAQSAPPEAKARYEKASAVMRSGNLTP
jgi:hypothetical protein